MIKIDRQPWAQMVEHARSAYPNECCGAMLGSLEDGRKVVSAAVPLENVSPGSQRQRYELRPQDLLNVEREASSRNLDVVGIYHSHPDCAAYFSETDLKNSVPWYSFVVLSIQKGEFDQANSWLPDIEQTRAEQEELIYDAEDSHSDTITPVRRQAGLRQG